MAALLVADKPHIDLKGCGVPSFQPEALLGKDFAKRLYGPLCQPAFLQS
jgi:hypothetical protein